MPCHDDDRSSSSIVSTFSLAGVLETRRNRLELCIPLFFYTAQLAIRRLGCTNVHEQAIGYISLIWCHMCVPVCVRERDGHIACTHTISICFPLGLQVDQQPKLHWHYGLASLISICACMHGSANLQVVNIKGIAQMSAVMLQPIVHMFFKLLWFFCFMLLHGLHSFLIIP